MGVLRPRLRTKPPKTFRHGKLLVRWLITRSPVFVKIAGGGVRGERTIVPGSLITLLLRAVQCISCCLPGHIRGCD
jgi:hypothetical protein